MRVAARGGEHDYQQVSQVVDQAAGPGTRAGMDRSPTDSFHGLLDLCSRYMSPADLDLLRRAYAVADTAHAGTERVSGEPYIEHPIAVATILAELAIDVYGIAAALLHDTVEDTHLTLEEVEAQFGAVVARIVDGVTKISGEVAEPAAGNTETPAQRRVRKAGSDPKP